MLVCIKHTLKRECRLNQLVLDDSCTRCSDPEDWNYVIQCSRVERKRNEWLSRLRRKLEKVDKTNADQMKTNTIISDIRKFLNDESDCQTNQELLGMIIFFRGTASQYCTGVELCNDERRKHNKIKAKESVLFCREWWLGRHKELQEEEKENDWGSGMRI